MPPETLSHYRILESLGAGGMGEVFKAQDTKLEREVALKLLPAEAVRDPERLQRFKQEALATSALNHPNITTIFEIGEDAGQHFICLEYVKGQTLRALLAAEKLELREVLAVAVQVAEGLHAAHQAGVVHRDLKPDNIMVREDGIAKILDFGLAKLSATEAANDQDETVVQSASDGLTRPGTVMGTVAYMSPEQARGQQLDHRSDVFSFGSILYEMAAGAQPFQAPSSVEVMHALIRDQPRPLHELNTDVPAELVRIIRKAMAKSPDERYQTAKDLAIDLRALEREVDSGSSSAVYPAAPSGAATAVGVSGSARAVQPSSGKPLLIVVGIAVVAVVTAAVFLMGRGGRTSVPTTSAPLRVSKITSSGDAGEPVFSPDGRFMAYDTSVDGSEAILLRQLATGNEVEIVPPRQDIVLGNIAFSPDGEWVLYTTRNINERQRTLWRVSTVGGAPREVLRGVDSAPSFSADGQRFLFSRFEGRKAKFLTASYTEVGEPEEIYETPEEAYVIAEPQWSPRGDIAFFQLDKDDVLHPKLMIKPADGGPPRPAPGPRWMQLTGYAWSVDGSQLFVSGSRSWVEQAQIWQVDPASNEVRRITSDLDLYSSVVTRPDGGALAAQKTILESYLWMVPIAGTSEANKAGTQRMTRGTDSQRAPDVHPDGSRVLFSSTADGHLNLWVMDLDGRNRKQLTFGDAQNFWSRWSPDGNSIAYVSEKDGDLQVWVMDADGQNARQLTMRGTTNYGADWSPDGKWIAYVSSQGDSSFIYKIPVGGGEPERVFDEQGVVLAEWSPDGKWIATWGGDRPGSPQQEVVLIPMQDGLQEERIQVTVQSNLELVNLRWHPQGDALAVALTLGETMNVHLLSVPGGTPQQVTHFEGNDLLLTHSWAPDASFLIVQRGARHTDIVLLENLP